MKTADQQIINLLNEIAAAQANAGGYSLQASSAGFAPADALTYFFGCFPNAVIETTANLRRLYIPRAGTIKRVFLFFQCDTPGTAELTSVHLRLNNTTDTLITASLALDTAAIALNDTALAISVIAGDYLEMKLVCPTWATNPAGVRPSAIIYIE